MTSVAFSAGSDRSSASLPEASLRGLRKKDMITQRGRVKLEAFVPPDNFKVADRTTAGLSAHVEVSIAWFDHIGAVQILSKDRANAGHGICRVPRTFLEHVRANVDNRAAARTFDFERRVLNENPFHGNVLLAVDLNEDETEQMAGLLASAVTKVIRREEIDAFIGSEVDELRLRVRERAHELWRRDGGSAHDNWMRARRSLDIYDDELTAL